MGRFSIMCLDFGSNSSSAVSCSPRTTFSVQRRLVTAGVVNSVLWVWQDGEMNDFFSTEGL